LKIWWTRGWREDLAVERGGAGEHQRRTETGGAHPGEPAALSSYGIDLENLRTAVSNSSVNAARGTSTGRNQDYQIDSNDQLVDEPGLPRWWWRPRRRSR